MMMRKEAFSQSDFDTTIWINAALAEREDEDLEAYLAACNIKVHVLSQEYNEQLEFHMQDIVASIPRITSEVTRIEDMLKVFEGEMLRLSKQLAVFDEKNSTGVEDLCRLDILKNNLEKCKDILEQHHQWNILLEESKQFIEGSSNLLESADCLENMNKSLKVLSKMPGHEERQETCIKLREGLLSSFLPKIRKALIATDLSPLLDYVYVYNKINKLSDFEIEYITIRSSSLFINEWDNTIKLSANINNSNSVISTQLNTFFSNVVKLTEEEYTKVNEIFGHESVYSILCRMITQLFATKHSAFYELIKTITSPTILVELFSITELFITNISSIFGSKGSLTSSNQALMITLTQTILKPFDLAHTYYVQLEEQTLIENVNRALDAVIFRFDAADRQDSYDSLYTVYTEYGDHLVSCCDEVFIAIEEGTTRGIRFMNGLCLKQLIDAITMQLGVFVKRVSNRLLDLRVALGLPLHHHAMPKKMTSMGGDDVEDSKNGKIAEMLLRRLRSQDHHVIDERMLVPCALRGLQFIGRLNSNLDMINADMDTRLNMLLVSLTSVKGKPTVDSDISFSLFSCLSLLDKTPERAGQLKSFLALYSKAPTNPPTATRSSTPVFTVVSSIMKKIRSVAGSLIIDLSTSTSVKLLQYLSDEPIWTKEAERTMQMDTVLPQQIVTQVGEHVLSIVQEIETFCTSGAQSDMVAATGDAALFATSGWQELRTCLGIKEEESLNGLCLRNSCRAVIKAAEVSMFGYTLAGSADYGEIEEIMYDDELVPQGSEEEAIQRFVNAWMGAILDNTFGLILCQICKIKKITEGGRLQLEADLGYLRNVVTALGAVSHPLLIHLSLIIYKEPRLLGDAVNSMMIQSPISALLNKIDGSIAAALIDGHGVGKDASEDRKVTPSLES